MSSDFFFDIGREQSAVREECAKNNNVPHTQFGYYVRDSVRTSFKSCYNFTTHRCNGGIIGVQY